MDPNTELLEKTRQRRAWLDQQLNKTSSPDSPTRKRRPLETANQSDLPESPVSAKRQSSLEHGSSVLLIEGTSSNTEGTESSQSTTRTCLYPTELLKAINAETLQDFSVARGRSPSKAVQTDISSVTTTSVAYSSTIVATSPTKTSAAKPDSVVDKPVSARKARFAALSAHFNEFEDESNKSIAPVRVRNVAVETTPSSTKYGSPSRTSQLMNSSIVTSSGSPVTSYARHQHGYSAKTETTIESPYRSRQLNNTGGMGANNTVFGSPKKPVMPSSTAESIDNNTSSSSKDVATTFHDSVANNSDEPLTVVYCEEQTTDSEVSAEETFEEERSCVEEQEEESEENCTEQEQCDAAYDNNAELTAARDTFLISGASQVQAARVLGDSEDDNYVDTVAQHLSELREIENESASVVKQSSAEQVCARVGVGRLATLWEKQCDGGGEFNGSTSKNAANGAQKKVFGSTPNLVPEKQSQKTVISVHSSGQSNTQPVARPVVMVSSSPSTIPRIATPYRSTTSTKLASTSTPVALSPCKTLANFAVTTPSSTTSDVAASPSVKKLRSLWEVVSATGTPLDPNRVLTEGELRMRSEIPRRPKSAVFPTSFSQSSKIAEHPHTADAKYVAEVKNAEPAVQFTFEQTPQNTGSFSEKPEENTVTKEDISVNTTVPASYAEAASVAVEPEDDALMNSELDACLDEAMAWAENLAKSSPVAEKHQAVTTQDSSNSEKEHPLMHTVSFYRQLQKQATPSLHKVRVETPRRCGKMVETERKNSTKAAGNNGGDFRAICKEKIKVLNEEVNKQISIVSQANRALQVCCTTDEFRGSREEVEAERLLLIASQRRSALVSEIDRVGRKLIEGCSSHGEVFGMAGGSLSISGITIPLKREFINHNVNGRDSLVHFYLCLVKHRDQVIHTEMLSTDDGMGRPVKQVLEFPNYIQLSNLPPDFTVTLEVYSLVTKKEQISHDEKYHINTISKHKGKTSSLFSTPSGSQQFVNIRATNFCLVGTLSINMQTIHSTGSKDRFALQGVPFSSSIESWVFLKLRCSAEKTSTEEHGFLNIHEAIHGTGAWCRYWCFLENNLLKYWRYPDDETIKEPLGFIDLRHCTSAEVGPVPKEICSRPFTFLLKMSSPNPSGAGNSKQYSLMVSADARDDFLYWEKHLNDVLRNCRLWDV